MWMNLKKRINFNRIFRIDNAGNVITRQTIKIGGLQLSPNTNTRGIYFSGEMSSQYVSIDLSQFIGRDFEVEKKNDVLIITGIY